MIGENQLFALLIALIIIYIVYAKLQFTEVSKQSNGVVRQWNVLARYKNSDEAAEMMSRLHNRMMEFLKRLKKKYLIGATEECAELKRLMLNPEFRIKREMIGNLLRYYNPELIVENDAILNPSTTSYTIDKESIHMCLRKYDNPSVLENVDVCLFVQIHEASHVMNRTTFGHTEVFWDSFKFLLREAYELGVYTPVDYSRYPVNFCGLDIRHNPFYD